MENVCEKCGKEVNDANIAACQGTPEGGCVWKSEALAAASVPVENIKPELLSADDAWLDAHYKAMVDRFLGWKLPQDFAPDCGISFTPPSELPDLYWPTGTNLLHAGQALEMFKHCAGLPAVTHVTLNHLTAKQEADLVEALRNSPPGSLEVAADPDAEKAAKVLAIVRAFVEKQRISFPEVIHQTDRVIENAYKLIQDLVDVAGYLPEEDEDDEASA